MSAHDAIAEISRATVADLDAIEDIERHSFPRPWTRAALSAELERDHARVWVARDPRGLAIAFLVAWVVAGELHVHSVAAHPDRRRAGIGGRLLARVLGDARAEGCTLATLEVRRGNAPAIALYERAGFATVRVRTGYYQDNAEDALVMVLDLSEPA